MVSSPTMYNENIFDKMKADSSLIARELSACLFWNYMVYYLHNSSEKKAQLLYENVLLTVG